MPSSDEEDDNSKPFYMESDIIIQRVWEKDKVEFEVVKKSNKKRKKIENSYDNDADFFDSSTQQQDLVGRDHDRWATTGVLSNFSSRNWNVRVELLLLLLEPKMIRQFLVILRFVKKS